MKSIQFLSFLLIFLFSPPAFTVVTLPDVNVSNVGPSDPRDAQVAEATDLVGNLSDKVQQLQRDLRDANWNQEEMKGQLQIRNYAIVGLTVILVAITGYEIKNYFKKRQQAKQTQATQKYQA